jgi:glycosyltransferase involved in cell wall biosynthesis
MLNHDRRRLRIAQVAPLYESVPPKLYGGTERVVAYLTEELKRRGHEVTLFATGDSTAAATIEATHPKSLRATGMVSCGNSLHLPMLSEVFDHAEGFDVIHCHLDYWSSHSPVS